MNSVLVIAGASASGKTTVAHILAGTGDFEIVRSVTTRDPRGDSFDSEYIYSNRNEFEMLISEGKVLEYTEYAGNLYGTPRSEIERISADGKIPLLILDLNGVHSIASADGINPCAVYLYDHMAVLDARLYDRYLRYSPNSEGVEKFISRKKQNISDYCRMDKHAPVLYAFVKGQKTPERTAQAVSDVFRDFLNGKEKDAEENLKVAIALKESTGI